MLIISVLWRLELNSTVKKFSLATILVLVLTSCSSMRGSGKDTSVIHERPGTDIVLVPENYVATYFTSEIHGERHCRAPDPDISVQSNDSIELGDVGGDSIGFADGVSGTELQGRSAALLLTRELMYRACEMTSNLNADEKTTIAIYEHFLKAIGEISSLQR
jgi:predicted small secreted protein